MRRLLNMILMAVALVAASQANAASGYGTVVIPQQYGEFNGEWYIDVDDVQVTDNGGSATGKMEGEAGSFGWITWPYELSTADALLTINLDADIEDDAWMDDTMCRHESDDLSMNAEGTIPGTVTLTGDETGYAIKSQSAEVQETLFIAAQHPFSYAWGYDEWVNSPHSEVFYASGHF